MSLSTQQIKELARDIIEYAAVELDPNSPTSLYVFRDKVERALFTVSREAYDEVVIPGD